VGMVTIQQIGTIGSQVLRVIQKLQHKLEPEPLIVQMFLCPPSRTDLLLMDSSHMQAIQ